MIVEDDREIRSLLSDFLTREGYATVCANDGAAMDRALLHARPDLIVLDIMLPGEDGLSICRRLRARGGLPILMLTAKGEDIDRIVGLEIGADDYLPKPVNPRELVARIRAVLRRAAPGAPARSGDISVGEIRLNAASRNAWVNEQKLDLTTAEFNLLEHLLRNAGRVVSRDDLSAAAFGRLGATGAADRNVDTLVSKVRRKLGPASDFDQRIKTVRNAGYIYAVPSA